MFSQLTMLELMRLRDEIDSAVNDGYSADWAAHKTSYLRMIHDHNKLLSEINGEIASRDWG